MVGRTCGTCGAPVPVLLDLCPACGDDPELQLVEVGALQLPGRRRRPDASTPTGRDRGADATRGRARVPIGLGVLVLLAVAGALAAGASGEEGDDDAAPPTGAPAPAFERPANTTTTTTTTAPILREPEAGFPVTGLLVTSAGSPVVAELDTGRVHRVRSAVVGASDGRLLVDTGAGLAWWPSPFDGVGAELLAEAVPGGQAWIDPATGTVWLYTYGEDPTLVSIGADGSGRFEHHVEAQFAVLGPAGGRMVVGAAGGTYAVAPTGEVERISTGSPVGAGGDTVYVTTCDEALRCRVDVLSAAGEVRATDAVSLRAVGFGPGIVSVDGRIATALYGDDGSAQVLIDGVPALQEPSAFVGGMSWSPDGRFLVVWHDNDLVVIDASSMMSFEMPYDGPDLAGWPLIVFDG